MKKIVILKMGDTLKSIKNQIGDFEDIIIKKCGLKKDEFEIIDCPKYDELPSINSIKGIIITGSHAMVSNYEPWSIKVEKFLGNVIDNNIPILGICYGHQLLGDVLGGKVGYNPKGMELGTVDIYLTEEGKKDKLLGVMPINFKAQVAHSQSILKLPKGVKVLAYNDFESVHSFIYKNNIWGVQFHPEFTGEFTKKYIEFEKENLEKNNKKYEDLYNSVEDNNYGEKLLKRFIKIINKEL